MNETNSSTPPSVETNILTAVPAFGGLIHWRCFGTLLEVDRRMNEAGILHSFNVISHESLIPRARNWFANLALLGADANAKPYSDLLFVDADISSNPDDVAAMLRADKPNRLPAIIRKGINWPTVVEAVKKGVTAEELPQFTGSPVLGFHNDKPFSMNEPTSVEVAGTGAMLIKISVLKAMAETHSEWKYKPGPPEQKYRTSHSHIWNDEAFDFFQIGVDPETRYYLSEDYFFVIEARKLGLETFVLPWAKTVH
jgi:hypothetical protein